MKEIRVLDCTLRDGGYCNDCQFGFENTKFIIDSLLRSGVDIIECGFLTQKVAYKQGVTRFNTLEQVKEVPSMDELVLSNRYAVDAAMTREEAAGFLAENGKAERPITG